MNENMKILLSILAAISRIVIASLSLSYKMAPQKKEIIFQNLKINQYAPLSLP